MQCGVGSDRKQTALMTVSHDLRSLIRRSDAPARTGRRMNQLVKRKAGRHGVQSRQDVLDHVVGVMLLVIDDSARRRSGRGRPTSRRRRELSHRLTFGFACSRRSFEPAMTRSIPIVSAHTKLVKSFIESLYGQLISSLTIWLGGDRLHSRPL